MTTLARQRIFEPATTGGASYRMIGATPSPPPAAGAEARVQNAVYGYIRARRALGVTRITTDEIARALKLPRRAVEDAAKALENRGVKAL